MYECKIFIPNEVGDLVLEKTLSEEEVEKLYWNKFNAPKIGRVSVTGPRKKTLMRECAWCKKTFWTASAKAICCPHDLRCIHAWQRKNGKRV